MNTCRKLPVGALFLALMAMAALAGCATATPAVEIPRGIASPMPMEMTSTATPYLGPDPYPGLAAVSQTEAAQAAPQPYPLPGGAEPMPTAMKPPLCQFGGGPTPEASGPTLEDFVFSEPRAVFTVTNATVGINEWLPDNQRLLIQHEPFGANRVSVEVLNTQTGSSQVYVEHEGDIGAFWLPQEQAVAYITLQRVTPSLEKDDLWISYGDPDKTKLLMENFPAWFEHDQGTVVLLAESEAELPIIPQSVAQSVPVKSLAVEFRKWAYPKSPEDIDALKHPIRFGIAQQPGGGRTVFFSWDWLFIQETGSPDVCEIDLHMQTIGAIWSPDGRYLALKTTSARLGQLLPFVHLAVLDTLTGEWYKPDLNSDYLDEIVWMPDSRHILGLVQMGNTASGHPIEKLVLVDIVSQKFRLLLPAYNFGGGENRQMSLSLSGDDLAIKCPIWPEGSIITADRICLVSISSTP